jgi:hypothetical protein
MTVSPLLPSLLYAALRGLERSYTEEGPGKHLVPSLDIWANLLRAVDPAGIDRRELPSILRLSQRAVRTRVSTAVRRGDASITGGNGVDWKPVHRAGANTVSDLPLSALGSQALVAFAMQYEELSPVALSLSTAVIRQIPPEGRPLHELGRSPGLSAVIRHGFVRAGGTGGREIACLTARGLEVHRAYEKRIHTVETSWRQQFGKDRVTALVLALEEAGV